MMRKDMMKHISNEIEKKAEEKNHETKTSILKTSIKLVNFQVY